MHILVINGSPKGENSATLQTVRFLERLHPEHTFCVLHAGQQIKSLERDFSAVPDMIARASLILFCYPVYTFIAPCQLHRFVELLKASGIDLSGKAATQITTSMHFYDVTAHRYIQDNCQELGMHFVRGLSAGMDDLLSARGQQDAEAFFDRTCWCIENGVFEPAAALPVTTTPARVTASHAEQALISPSPFDRDAQGADKPGDVVIVSDCAPENEQLCAMIARFRDALPLKTRVIDLRAFPFAGGCLGCLHCAVDGTCVYKDGFDAFLREQIQTAQAIVYAFTVSDHSMGARMKCFDDRQFCNGHRTVTMGKPVGYLISGPYRLEANLQMIVEARAQVGGNFLAGVATDESCPDAEIDKLAASLCDALQRRFVPPQNFYGVGGMKIFRDMIYQMRGMMKADHRFYKEHGFYDFPQKNRGMILKMYLVGALLSSERIRAKMGNRMTEAMVSPYLKVLEGAKPQPGGSEGADEAAPKKG